MRRWKWLSDGMETCTPEGLVTRDHSGEYLRLEDVRDRLSLALQALKTGKVIHLVAAMHDLVKELED